MNAVTQEPAQLMSREGMAATLQSVQIEGQLDGLLLGMIIRQHYMNSSTDNIEAVYTFPLPWGATLLGLNGEIDGHRLQGTVLEKKQATQRYEKAIDEGDTPIMVERSARGLYTANLGNLKPGETAVIEIEYAQLLRFEQGQIRITVPTTVAPRYGDAHKTGGLASHESVDASLLVQYPLTVTIILKGEIAQASVQAPSHAVSMSRLDDALKVSLNQGAFLDRDFVLLLQGLQGQSFVTVAPDGEQFAVLASFCPQIPPSKPEALLLKVLVDCSGSMGGDSISAARQALHEVMKELTELDWISYSRFGNNVEHHLPGLQPCSAATIKHVSQLVASTDADLGGTQMNDALLSTFKHGMGGGWRKLFDQARVADHPKDVLLITDGDIWHVEEVIASAKSSGHRIFAIGVGSAPAESLLREVAEKSGGACELVSPNQDVAAVIVRMFRRMRSIRCNDLTVNWGQDVSWQCALPKTLYGADTIHLCSRMAAKPPVSPVLSWVSGGNTMTSSAARIQSVDSDLLSRMIACSQIAELSEQISLYQRTGEAAVLANLKAQSLELALKYQLVTDQTNLLLVHIREEAKKAEGLPTLQNITHMQAAGWGGAGSVVPQSGQISYNPLTPSVWRCSTSVAVGATVDALSFGGMDDFEIPTFLRKQADYSTNDMVKPPMARARVSKPVPPALSAGPLTTPLELLRSFENSSKKLLAPHRFVRELQMLNVPSELTKLLDDLTVILGSGTKAWALVLQWLANKLSNQFSLSRQSARLLRHALKDEDAQKLEEMMQTLAGNFEHIASDDWHLEAVQTL